MFLRSSKSSRAVIIMVEATNICQYTYLIPYEFKALVCFLKTIFSCRFPLDCTWRFPGVLTPARLIGVYWRKPITLRPKPFRHVTNGIDEFYRTAGARYFNYISRLLFCTCFRHLRKLLDANSFFLVTLVLQN